ncbi:YaaA family protein [Agromyces bauzanensis]|uniref:Peroxide stress protein YaaA n=1 Tax=Agromyces bauzanensis TaxID=1308924 RepID=A0A917PBV3_9MICO|nr:peroxide stress protein YaaA [Agromyces bauzanensis]GGJ70310.1 peroxide stress protein YaaA [Agromyces bauzanensis]
MLLLLPPSETKRDGGEGAPLDIATLAFPGFSALRVELVERLAALAADADAMMHALRLGPRLTFEVERNRALREAPTMAAIDRYTGVLFDALDAGSLDEPSRSFAADTVMVHSALFGPVGALDAIPAYRLSHDSHLPGLSLRSHWRDAIASRLAAHRGVIVDLRSEGYAELGPAPARANSAFVRVVAEGADGRRRAPNHFNKQAKGRFTRALLESRPDVASLDELVDWATTAGFTFELLSESSGGAPHELELVA